MRKYKILLVIVVLILLILRLQSAIRSLGSFYLTLEPMLLHPHATYSEKMSTRYPVYFDFIQFIKISTSETSTIYIPDMNIAYGNKIWAITNNQITSALLFPRKIVYGKENTFPKHDTNGYIVVIGRGKNIYVNQDGFYLVKNGVVVTFQSNKNSETISSEAIGLIKL
jgi:hypothetical protein